jgi:hypothetical protein
VVTASGGIGRLTELLPNPLADAGQAPMLGPLEDLGNVFLGGLRGSLRGWVGLEEGERWQAAEAGSNKVNATG